MIHHSQPFVTPNLEEKINFLIKEKNFSSNFIFKEVHSLFLEYFKQENLYFTQSGTHAIYWILKGLGLSKEDEVILPSYACPSIHSAVLSVGCQPVLCDIGERWHMSPHTVQAKITKKTKVILLVNLFGMFLDCSLFRFPGIILLNDLCQSPHILKTPQRDHGDFICYSFHPTKFLNGGGYGAFSINNSEIPFKNFLQDNILKSDLSNINLLILKEQILHYQRIVDKRKKIAYFYFSHIKEEYTSQIEKEENSFYRFPICQYRYNFEDIQHRFQENEIYVKRGVDQLIHRLQGERDENYPKSVQAFNRTVSIPLYPSLREEEAYKIIKAIKGILS